MPKLDRLTRIELRSIWAQEAKDFTPWLAQEDNLNVLAETLGLELELQAQETQVGPFRADILCKNPDGGSWVLIENQLTRTDHSHLGQLLTYAAGLHAVTVCWIAERFSDEHRATLDWLNEITDERFRFFGLEVELWQIGESLPAPKFNLVSKPNDWSRSVTASARTPAGELTPKRQAQKAFWTALMRELEATGSPVKPKKPQATGWMQFSIGRSEFWLEATIQSTEMWIGVHLTMTGRHASTYFRMLQRDRPTIERVIGKLEWREPPDKKSSAIRIRRTETDPMNEQDWPEQFQWMTSMLTAFNRVFRARVKELNAETAQHEDDTTRREAPDP